MKKEENAALVDLITNAGKKNNYDEVSKLVLRANAINIRQIVACITVDSLNDQALSHILETLPPAEWHLCEGLSINERYKKMVLSISMKKYQEEFNEADRKRKIEMFKEVRNDYLNKNYSFRENSMLFMKNNWQRLIHLIGNLETGIEVYEALFIPNKESLWSTIAALRTIEVACNNKVITEIEKLYSLFYDSFQNEFDDPIRVRLAEIVLKKMKE